MLQLKSYTYYNGWSSSNVYFEKSSGFIVWFSLVKVSRKNSLYLKYFSHLFLNHFLVLDFLKPLSNILEQPPSITDVFLSLPSFQTISCHINPSLKHLKFPLNVFKPALNIFPRNNMRKCLNYITICHCTASYPFKSLLTSCLHLESFIQLITDQWYLW